MPIYEYECGICQCRFEKKQGFDAEPVAICPECQGMAFRVIQSLPLIFKGNGFYITDHRNDNSSKKDQGELTTKQKEGKGK